MESPEVPGKNLEVNEYQEALSYIRHGMRFFNAINPLSDGFYELRKIQELVDIYPEYLELKAKATSIKPIYNKNECDYQCKCEVLIHGWEDYCHACGQALDWSDDE